MEKYKINTIIGFTISAFLLLGCDSPAASTIDQENTNPEADLSEPGTPTPVKVVDGLSIPWGMDWLPNGDLLITEKSGKIYRFDGTEKFEIANGPDIIELGQGGLLDVTLHPNYESNGWIYFSYASSAGEGRGGNTAIMRAKLENDQLVEQEVLYKATPNTNAGVHFGSRIVFDNQGYLYFSVGDRGQRDVNPQDITRDGGKIYRIHDDGTIPTSNPFYGQDEAIQAIYSYGHRNPQGMVKHPETGEIWIHEHGPKGGDEVNIIRPGDNYGWPVISYGINYDGTSFTDITEKEGMEQPLWYWVPSIAPSGMDFVTGDRYPEWQGDLMVGSLRFRYLMHCKVEDGEITSEQPLFEDIGRLRNVKMGPDGYLYMAVENEGIFRIEMK
jgi:glucose/arabinose dehydrogenase